MNKKHTFSLYPFPFTLFPCLLCLVILFLPVRALPSPDSLAVQESKTFIYMSEDQYAFIDYLINSGRKMPGFVFQQPYETDLFKENGKYSGFFGNFWDTYYAGTGLSGQLLLSNKGKYQNESLLNRYHGSGGFHIVYPNITLGNRTTIDQEYKYDPKYAGDLSESDNWLWGRVNDAYMNLNFKNFDFFIGRMKRNWGPIGKHSFMLSNHPYTYDHLMFSYQNRWLKLSILAARLEDLSAFGFYPGEIGADSLAFYHDAHKYLVGHRLDFRILENLQIGLSEMATFGGPDRQFDWSFLNPMTFYYGLQRNDKKQVNPNWTLDIFYKPAKKVTLYGQFFIDDIIVNNEPGQNDRARYDDRLAVYASVRAGDLPLRGLNADLSYTRVWNRAYQSRWTYENYHYRELGLGYPCASCDEVRFKVGYWGLFPLFVENEFIYGRYGDVQLTDVNLLQKESFPVPPVTTNYVNVFFMKYYFKAWLDAFLKVEYFKEPNHYLNRLNEGSQLTISLGVNLLIRGHLGFAN